MQGGPGWRLILEEELFEATAETEARPPRWELVQTAAVIAAWISDIDRRTE